MSQQSNPNPQRNRILMIAGGVAVLAICLCALVGLAAGGYYLYSGQQALPTGTEPVVEYILDASPRMDQPLEGGTRISVARAVLAEVVRPADPTVSAGLRVFGSGAVVTGCEDTDLVVPLAPSNQSQIADSALVLEPSAASDSALAEAMLAAIRDLAGADGPHTLVVITGGADACNAQAGELLKQEAEKAGIQLQEFVIGFAVTPAEADAIKSMVADSGGTYLDAPDSASLANILLAIQNHVDNPTTTSLAVVELLATPGAIENAPTAVAGGDPTQQSQPDATTEGTLPGVSGYQAQSACDHPYFPVRTGASWQYTTDGVGYTWIVNSVSGDLSNATASISAVFDTGSVTYEWTCNGEGVSYFSGGNVVSGGDNFSMKVTESHGASILSAANMFPGASWTSGYTVTYDFSSVDVSLNTTSTIEESHTAGELQSLSTGLGTFDALPIVGDSTFTSTNSAGTFTSNSHGTIYLAYGIGIIRSESVAEGASATTELVSYSIPE
jgi:hypothetical protein